MSKTMIEVSNVTMRFRMNNDKILSLKEFITAALRGKLEYQDFTALDHVSFEVKKGETFGLVGRNGAGSTGQRLQAPEKCHPKCRCGYFLENDKED